MNEKRKRELRERGENFKKLKNQKQQLPKTMPIPFFYISLSLEFLFSF